MFSDELYIKVATLMNFSSWVNLFSPVKQCET